MANEHLRTAAANLQRAVSDVRELQRQIRADIDNTRHNNDKTINDINNQIIQLENLKKNAQGHESDKLAAGMKQQMLHAEISKIHSNTDAYVRQQSQKLSDLDGQIREFENLAGRLNSLA